MAQGHRAQWDGLQPEEAQVAMIGEISDVAGLTDLSDLGILAILADIGDVAALADVADQAVLGILAIIAENRPGSWVLASRCWWVGVPVPAPRWGDGAPISPKRRTNRRAGPPNSD